MEYSLLDLKESGELPIEESDPKQGPLLPIRAILPASRSLTMDCRYTDVPTGPAKLLDLVRRFRSF